MDLGRARRKVSMWLAVALAAGLVPAVAQAGGVAPPPKDFARASLLSGSALTGERSARAVLLHAQWFDNEGRPQKYFKRTRRFPWPKALTVSESSFRIRLDGVRYPGRLDVGVFKRTGPQAAPVGKHELYTCTFDVAPGSPCRWIPSVANGRQVWDVQVDHMQKRGHLYVVAVGTWDDPRDPPKPVGTRGQIGTWILHAKLGP